MNTRNTHRCFVLSIIALNASLVLDARAQNIAPELVQPGVISLAGRHETFPAQDPTDGSLWFSTYSRGFAAQTILRAAVADGGWSDAEVVAFSGTYGDRAPRFSPDGSQLFFTSNRPIQPGGERGDMNIWMVNRRNGGWSEPSLVPSPVSSDGSHDIHNTVTRGGTIYVASSRPESRGRSDIFRIPMTSGSYGEAEQLGPSINDELSQPDLFVSADETWMVLAITDHPDGLGGDDLYVSEFRDNEWTTPRNLGAPINSSEYEYGPTLSRDGRYLYFTSHRGGSADVYRIPVTALGLR